MAVIRVFEPALCCNTGVCGTDPDQALMDLALFSESRYTRHPSQADLHSALQDHPGAFDHFPTGSLMSPPAHLTATHERLAGKTTSSD